MAETSEEQTDECLMTLIQSGDHEAFCVLVRRHTGMFYTAAYRICADQDEAEDIVQDAFLKLWHKAERWNGAKGVKFTTWFYRVVTNQALDHVRKKRPDSRSDVIEHMVDHNVSQHADMELQEDQSALEEAIQALPERQKLALNLCFYEGLSNKEAAEIIGVKVKALESLLMRAKAKLKDHLTRQGYLDQEDQYYGQA